jgi:hypothetical protein
MKKTAMICAALFAACCVGCSSGQIADGCCGACADGSACTAGCCGASAADCCGKCGGEHKHEHAKMCADCKDGQMCAACQAKKQG